MLRRFFVSKFESGVFYLGTTLHFSFLSSSPDKAILLPFPHSRRLQPSPSRSPPTDSFLPLTNSFCFTFNRNFIFIILFGTPSLSSLAGCVFTPYFFENFWVKIWKEGERRRLGRFLIRLSVLVFFSVYFRVSRKCYKVLQQ